MNFPAELCRLVTQDPVLDKNDLRALCFVSANFRDEAELLLYVDIRLMNLGQIVSWAKSVIKRPYLGPRTKSLSVTMPPQMSIDLKHLEIIVKAVHLCANMTSLEVLNHTWSLSGSAVNAWIFENHPYRLLYFRNTYFSGTCLNRFFAQQPTIRTLRFYPEGETKYMEYHDSFFPNLITLDTSSTGLDFFSRVYFPHRTIERLKIRMSNATENEELGFIISLSLRPSIKNLSIVRNNGVKGMDIATLMVQVMRVLPRLQLFQLLDNTTHVGL